MSVCLSVCGMNGCSHLVGSEITHIDPPDLLNAHGLECLHQPSSDSCGEEVIIDRSLSHLASRNGVACILEVYQTQNNHFWTWLYI